MWTLKPERFVSLAAGRRKSMPSIRSPGGRNLVRTLSCHACWWAKCCAAPTPMRASSTSIRAKPPLPGVKAVITGNDLPQITLGASGPGGVATAREYYVSREILARDKVLFHGHVVAAVAAISSDIAEAAVDLIEVEYDVLPHVTDPVAAMQPDAVCSTTTCTRRRLRAKLPYPAMWQNISKWGAGMWGGAWHRPRW